MGKVIGSLIISYLMVGGVIFGSQLALSTFLDPVCIGAEQHRLLDRYLPPRTVASRQGLSKTVRALRMRSATSNPSRPALRRQSADNENHFAMKY
jgi:hypothetical protein